MFFASIPLFLLFASVTIAVPILEGRQAAVSALSTADIASYKPYTYYAAAAHCPPASTIAWNCGASCSANAEFKPIASGGDGALTQYWFVGYDPNLKSVVVAYQGSDFSKFFPLITDAKFILKPLDSKLFPGISSSVKTHDGFGDAQKRSATAVLAAVKTAMSKYAITKVTVVGHSLGGSIALVSTAYLSLNLPSSTSLQAVTYGSSRVGNQAFVDFINPRANLTRIDNKNDVVPILPGRFLGYAHTNGEIHITNSNGWMSCPGQDNTNSQCTIGYVPNIFAGNAGDHNGPYDGVYTTCF